MGDLSEFEQFEVKGPAGRDPLAEFAEFEAPGAAASTTAPADPNGPARTRALSAAGSVPGGLQVGAAMRALLEGGRDVAAGRFGTDLVGAYQANRDALAGGLARDQAAYPDEARQGTALGYGAQFLGSGGTSLLAQGARALPTLARTALTAPKSLVTTPLGIAKAAVTNPRAAASGAYTAAKRGAAPGAFYGGLAGATGSEGDLTRGEFGQVGLDAILGAGWGAVLGALIGAPFGAAQGGLQGARASTRGRAIDAADLDELAAAREAQPGKVAATQERNAAATEAAATETKAENARRLAAAEAESRRGTPARAKRMIGLDKVKMDPVERKAVADALYAERGPGGGSLVEELYAQPPLERYQSARKLRDDVGKEIGRIRKQVQDAGGQREAKVVLERLREDIVEGAEPLKTEAERNAYASVEAAVEKAAGKNGVLDGNALADLSDDAGSLGYAALNKGQLEGREKALHSSLFRRARAVLAKEYAQVVSEVTPTNVPAFEAANKKYGPYKRLEQGTKALANLDDSSLEGRRLTKLVKPEKVKVEPKLEELPPEPQFPGGPEAELAAEARLAPRGPRAKVLASRLGGMYLGSQIGHPFVVGDAAARLASAKFLKQARPSARVFVGDAVRAQQALERHAPLLQMAMARGPRAVAAMQAFLIDNDPEYAAAYGGQ